jgi:DNA segregation ATPase FtsK/SpoIIIE-like protein
MNKRFDMLKQAGVPSLAAYNQGRGEGARLERIVLIIDELAYALEEDAVEEVLVDVIARGGAVGIHPVLATQRPSSDVITPRLKGNLLTRIALPVPSRADSMVILDRTGAESIAKIPGRLLIAHGARLIEAQAFKVDGEQIAASNVRQLSANTRLSEREQRIAQIAVERGWFKIREIHEATGQSPNYLVDFAQMAIAGVVDPGSAKRARSSIGTEGHT